MFIPSAESAYDTSYFMSRYIWNPEDEHVHGESDCEDTTETCSGTCSSGSFSNVQDEEVCGFFFFNFLFLYSNLLVSLHIKLLMLRLQINMEI